MRHTVILFLGSLLLSPILTAQISTEVQLFQPQIISNGQSFGLTISPDGHTAYFVNSFGGRQQLQLMESVKKNGNGLLQSLLFLVRKELEK